MTPARLAHTAAVLAEVLTFERPADALLAAYWRRHPKLGRQDRHRIAETIFAALRHYQKILALLPDAPRHTRAAALLALQFGGEDAAALADEAERELLKRAAQTDFSGCLTTASELPQWLTDTLRAGGWDDARMLAFGRSSAQSAPLDLRVNTLKARRSKILPQLQAEFAGTAATPYAPYGIRIGGKPSLAGHPLFAGGALEVQDEGSQLLALLLGARRGETVVDFCAGAGGKTLAIGAQMAGSGRIYAFDTAEKRLANIKPRLERAGLTNVRVERIAHEHDARLQRLAGKADRVLVDAPCSGMGTLRRQPDLKYRHNPDSVAELVRLQQSVLAAAAQLVRPGGRLVYATCSVLPAENAAQAAAFLAAHPDFAELDAADILRAQKIPLDTGRFLELDTGRHGTDGFFAVVMERRR